MVSEIDFKVRRNSFPLLFRANTISHVGAWIFNDMTLTTSVVLEDKGLNNKDY